MIRRNVRLRKEYLYRKSLEGQEREAYEKKRKIRTAVAEGKPVPTELRAEAENLLNELKHEDVLHDKQIIDDEYARAGIKDPRVFITTSFSPSPPLKQFAKEMVDLFPNSQRLNRGNHSIEELAQACRKNDITDLIILHEHRGIPNGMIISHFPYGPTAYFGIGNCVLRHQIQDLDPSLPKQDPHLIFNNFSTKLGERAQNILKYLFPVPKEDSQRVVTFSNENDYVSFRNHYYKRDGPKIELKELGPRFELKLYQITLATLEMKDADVEWVYRPYMNTTKKRSFLAEKQQDDPK